MTSTINTRTSLPATTQNKDIAAQPNQRPSVAKVAMLGAAAAFAILGASITLNGGSETAQTPAVLSPASAATQTAVQGPNYELPATWTEWSMTTASSATNAATPANVR